jgi:glycosyltransferase involved in cell wall biosynthesis
MHMRKIAIIIPCFNEAARLPVSRFGGFLKTTDTDLIFVNDGSTDNTAAVLETLKEIRPVRVTVINEAINRGKAEAVRRGVCLALGEGYEYVGFWDADLATPLEEIPDFLQVLEQQQHLDMIFGARVKLLGRNVRRKASRHYLGRVFATFVSWTLGIPIYDTQCGAKLFRVTSHSQKLFGQPFLSRWVFDVEIIARYLQEMGRTTAVSRIYEFPLRSWIDVAGSKLRATDFFIAFWDILRIRRTYLSKEIEQPVSVPEAGVSNADHRVE